MRMGFEQFLTKSLLQPSSISTKGSTDMSTLNETVAARRFPLHCVRVVHDATRRQPARHFVNTMSKLYNDCRKILQVWSHWVAFLNFYSSDPILT